MRRVAACLGLLALSFLVAGRLAAVQPGGDIAAAALRLATTLALLLPAALCVKGSIAPKAPSRLPVGLALPVFLLVVLAANLLPAVQGGGVTTPQGAPALVLWYLATCLVPAVLEEAIFRGGLFALVQPYGAVSAVGYTSLCFALLHQSTLPVLVAALALGLVRALGGSLTLCMGLHLANNSLAFLLLCLPAAAGLLPWLLGVLVLWAWAGVLIYRKKLTLHMPPPAEHARLLANPYALLGLGFCAAVWATRLL